MPLLRTIASIVLAGLLTAVASAEPPASPPDRPTTRPERATSRPDSAPDLLAGPTVTETVARGADERPVPFAPWTQVLRGLDLTAEQRASIESILRRFQAERRRFRAEHGERLDALRRAVRERRARDAAEDDAARARRREYERLRSAVPRPEPVQERIWAMLDDAQRAAMRAGLAEVRSAARERARAPRDAIAARFPDLDDASRRRIRFLLRGSAGAAPSRRPVPGSMTDAPDRRDRPTSDRPRSRGG